MSDTKRMQIEDESKIRKVTLTADGLDSEEDAKSFFHGLLAGGENPNEERKQFLDKLEVTKNDSGSFNIVLNVCGCCGGGECWWGTIEFGSYCQFRGYGCVG